MTNLFLLILNMSITASYVALAVMSARLFLRRAPKIFSYILWSAVAIRLVLPVSFTSSFSLLRFVQPQNDAGTGYIEYVSQDMGLLKNPVVTDGIREIGQFVHSSLPAAAWAARVNPLQIILWVGSFVWIAGVAVLLLYSVISYMKFAAKIRTATLVRDNIFETDQIATPLVCGFIKPKIYVPTGLSEQQLFCILLHEQTHIARRDYLIKPFAFLLVILHWFNPLMWLAYSLMSKDMEMSCDERVVGKMGDQIKGSYSNALLSLSLQRSGFPAGSPLAFGEGNVKARIKNVLSYREPTSRMIACAILVIAALVAGCATNPKPLSPPSLPSPQPSYHGYQLDKLLENKTPYVGNHVKVGGLISATPKPTGLEGKGLALQTTEQPYGVTVHYVMNDSAGVVKEGAINGETFYRNAIVLLSLIDNVGSITYSIVDMTGSITYSIDDKTGYDDSAEYSLTFTREQTDKLLGEDVRQYATDEASLRQLIDRLDRLPFNETAM